MCYATKDPADMSQEHRSCLDELGPGVVGCAPGIVGGLAGTALGIVASKVLSALAGWPTLISPTAVIGGFAFAAAVGLFFGWYPARNASMLDPIEALLSE